MPGETVRYEKSTISWRFHWTRTEKLSQSLSPPNVISGGHRLTVRIAPPVGPNRFKSLPAGPSERSESAREDPRPTRRKSTCHQDVELSAVGLDWFFLVADGCKLFCIFNNPNKSFENGGVAYLRPVLYLISILCKIGDMPEVAP